MASFQGQQGHREKDGMLPKQHNAHISKQKPPYGEQNISDALNVFGNGILSWERLQTEMAPCQTQTTRHSRAPSKDRLKRSKCSDKRVAKELQLELQMQLWWEFGRKTISAMPTLLSANCCTERKLLPNTNNSEEGSYHSSMGRKSMWKERNNEQNE